jgi:hypothetical protein
MTSTPTQSGTRVASAPSGTHRVKHMITRSHPTTTRTRTIEQGTTVKLAERSAKTLVTLMVALGVMCFAPSPVFAEFSRPFIEQLPTGTAATGIPFGGIAIDTGGIGLFSGNVWVGGSTSSGVAAIDEFSASGEFLRQIQEGEAPPPLVSPVDIESPGSLAFDDLTEQLYTSLYGEYIAVDNSTSLDEGDVYFASDGAVRRVTSAPGGAPVDFDCPGAAYIRNGNELIGRPAEDGVGVQGWGGGRIQGIAVDSSSGQTAGDIYVLIGGAYLPAQVDVFTPEGCFIRAITGHIEEGGKEVALFDGGPLEGIAVDPSDGDLVVTVTRTHSIDEFGASGEFLGQIKGASKGAPFEEYFNEDGGLAAGSGGELYVDVASDIKENAQSGGRVADAHAVDVLGPGGFYPGTVTGEVTERSPGGVTLNGVVRGAANPEGKNLSLAECHFEYVTEEAYAKSVAEDKSGFSGFVLSAEDECAPGLVGQRLEEKNYAVHADIDHLVSGEVYRYRLVAETRPGESEHGGTKDGEVASFAAAGAPVVEAVSVGHVSSSFADLRAVIDPVGSDTTYRFEYVTEAAFAQSGFGDLSSGGSVPAPAGEVGSGDAGVSVNVVVRGLLPGTSYRFRVLAENAIGADLGGADAEGTFSTLPAAVPGLPDDRAYELVTPANKGDAKDMFGGLDQGGEVSFDVGYASEDGDHFLLQTSAAFGRFPASAESAYVFSRSEHGWLFQSLASPSLGVQSVGNIVFDPVDFSMVAFQDEVGYVHESDDGLVGPLGGPYSTVGATGGSAVGGGELTVIPVGASEDLSNAIVESQDRELPMCEASEEALAKTLDAGSQGLYEWSAVRGCLALADVKSEGGGLLSQCGAVLGQHSQRPGSTHDAVSSDGSRIFFTAPDPNVQGNGSSATKGCWNSERRENPPELYMRVNGETTIEVSEPEGGGTPEYPAVFVGASRNGSKVFFVTRGDLTKEATVLRNHEPELYEYDAEASEGERLVRVSRGDLESGPVEGKVLDVPAISADGSTVYFNAEGDLTPKADGGGLYRYDTETGQTTYVAPPQGYPTKSSVRAHELGEDIQGLWYEHEVKDNLMAGLDLEAEYQTTRDGQFLLFGPYRYDAADGSTMCVMCNPGSSPRPEAGFGRTAEFDSQAGGPPRAMSENGEFVFFDSSEPLLPQATNGKVDVYEWRERRGSAAHEGTISLISSGQSSTNDYFLDSSPCVNSGGETVEGCNVFFGTHSQLVPADKDEEGDLYDARIEGGFPAPLGAGPCEGDACHNPPPLPLLQTPATSTHSSSGNIVGGRESNSPPPGSSKPKAKSRARTCKKPHGKKKSRTCPKAKKAKRAKKAGHGRAGR